MSAPVEPGEVLAGKYKVERVLGVGGMGVVVAAMHLELDERVAIKFLTEEALGNEEAVERFAREARAAVRIKSEHVARVIDVGKLDNGAPYMVMEYLRGEDLAERLSKAGHLPAEEVSEYVLQAGEAIAEAHALGIVHRDLKPGNLFLAEQPDGSRKVKVLDFGISKATSRGSRSEMALTKTTTIMGSPLYMSPEQMRASRDVDARADIWSIGVIMYELVTGQVAFDAPTMPQLCTKILADDPEPPTRVRPGVPPRMEAIIKRCLHKSAESRYQSMAELADDLVKIAPRRVASVERIHRVLANASKYETGVVQGGDGARPQGSPTMAGWDKGSRPQSRGATWVVIAGGALGAACVAGLALWLLRGGATHATPAAQPDATVTASATASARPSSEPTVTVAAPLDTARARPEGRDAPVSAEPSTSASAPVPSAEPSSGAKVPVARPVAPKPAPTAEPAAAPKPVPKKRADDLFADPK